MTITIKGWKSFQHFKDRRPPWIKLYRDLLDDPDWHDLSGDDAKALTMLWLIASEDEGRLPCVRKLAFRLRMKEAAVTHLVKRLSHFLDQDDIAVISDGYQDDAPETEGETEGETETEISDEDFDRFKSAYPKRAGAMGWQEARKRLNKAIRSTPLAAILGAAEKYKAEGGDPKFVRMPEVWLHKQSYLDYPDNVVQMREVIHVEEGTPEMAAWDSFLRKTTGLSAIRSKHGGYFPPTRWPPGHEEVA
jgi:hypothetical protein